MEMTETKYEIIDICGVVLATGMTYEMALAFIDGFKVRFYNEPLYLTIKEISKPMTEDEVWRKMEDDSKRTV